MRMPDSILKHGYSNSIAPCVSKCGPGVAASALPGSLLETQNLGPPLLTETECSLPGDLHTK